MAFKMKNPSMAKLTKAAGDNRAAMKMKMEKEAAAKMKRESAMKMEKESMAKLMDKASAMKLKDGGKGTTRITDKDLDKKQKIEDAANKGDKMAQLVRRYNALGPKALSPEELKMINKSSPKKMKKYSAMKLKKESPVKKDGEKDKIKKTYSGGKPLTGEDTIKRLAANEMRTNPGMTMAEAMKNARKIYKISLETPPATKMKSPAKQKMNMVKGPDGKMVPDFAVDGKGANDMKSATKMKPGKATGKAVRQKKREARQEERRGRKMARKLKRVLKDKTPGTGLKKKDSAVKMVKAVRKEQKVTKIKPTQKPTPKNNKLKPVKQTFKKLKKPSVTAKL